MNILFRLFGRRSVNTVQKAVKESDVSKQINKEAAQIIEETPDNVKEKITDAIKAKYFTKVAKAANGGETVMEFDKESGKLVRWTRSNPDGTVVQGKINSYLAPTFRVSRITDGDKVTCRVKATLGNVSEVYNETYDLSQFPKVFLTKEQNTFVKGKKSGLQLENNTEEYIVPKFLTKSDYKDILNNL